MTGIITGAVKWDMLVKLKILSLGRVNQIDHKLLKVNLKKLYEATFRHN